MQRCLLKLSDPKFVSVVILLLLIVVARNMHESFKVSQGVFLLLIPCICFSMLYATACLWPEFFYKLSGDEMSKEIVQIMNKKDAKKIMNTLFVSVFFVFDVMFFQSVFVQDNNFDLTFFGKIIIAISFLLLPAQFFMLKKQLSLSKKI